mmetsp:Transcript_28334/g.61296  ORF Transcript_28334/g.61296 Transcript_28334/m.61296 type:complete len:322 (-) Transcript_28334:51-1016(-)
MLRSWLPAPRRRFERDADCCHVFQRHSVECSGHSARPPPGNGPRTGLWARDSTRGVIPAYLRHLGGFHTLPALSIALPLSCTRHHRPGYIPPRAGPHRAARCVVRCRLALRRSCRPRRRLSPRRRASCCPYRCHSRRHPRHSLAHTGTLVHHRRCLRLLLLRRTLLRALRLRRVGFARQGQVSALVDVVCLRWVSVTPPTLLLARRRQSHLLRRHMDEALLLRPCGYCNCNIRHWCLRRRPPAGETRVRYGHVGRVPQLDHLHRHPVLLPLRAWRMGSYSGDPRTPRQSWRCHDPCAIDCIDLQLPRSLSRCLFAHQSQRH